MIANHIHNNIGVVLTSHVSMTTNVYVGVHVSTRAAPEQEADASPWFKFEPFSFSFTGVAIGITGLDVGIKATEIGLKGFEFALKGAEIAIKGFDMSIIGAAIGVVGLGMDVLGIELDTGGPLIEVPVVNLRSLVFGANQVI